MPSTVPIPSTTSTCRDVASKARGMRSESLGNVPSARLCTHYVQMCDDSVHAGRLDPFHDIGPRSQSAKRPWFATRERAVTIEEITVYPTRDWCCPQRL